MKYIIKGRVKCGTRQWLTADGPAYDTKKDAQETADRLNRRGTGCVEYKVFKEEKQCSE